MKMEGTRCRDLIELGRSIESSFECWRTREDSNEVDEIPSASFSEELEAY